MSKITSNEDIPRVGMRVTEAGPSPRGGEVRAVLQEYSNYYIFVVKWWLPHKRRHCWSCHTQTDWEFGLVSKKKRNKKANK